MGDHTLQLVAVQQFQAATCDADGYVALRVPGREGTNAALGIQNVYLRHRHAGGNGHLLDDVEQLLLVLLGCIRRETAATQ